MTVSGIIGWSLFGLMSIGVMVFALISLYHNNRLLFKCLVGVLIAYMLTLSGLYGAGKLMANKPEELRISIATLIKDPPKEEKKIEMPKKLDLPAGLLTGNPKVTKMPKGSRNPKSGQRKFGNNKMIVSDVGTEGDVAYDPDAKDYFGMGNSLDPKDLNNFGAKAGEQFGDPDGEGDGEVPYGFPEGKVGGKAYFIRMKHGSGAWNAYDDGTKRLLSFLNQYFKCQSETWPIAAGEIRERYISKGSMPSFLYLYCDESFSLNSTEVAVLTEYMSKGGFLFLDSRASPEVRERVKKEMDKVLPGMRLAALSARHPINSALFRLDVPGVGENYIEQKNYGITGKSGKLVLFYTPGNFAHLYANFKSADNPYYLAQYQMGANVMVYAMAKGHVEGGTKYAGASAKITKQVLESLGLLTSSGPVGPNGQQGSVKVKPEIPPSDPNAVPDEPDEINLN